MVCKTDLDGIIIYANSRFSKISGYSNDELIGRNSRLCLWLNRCLLWEDKKQRR
ncbi:MAG: hypothetical protein COA44_11080 [Arcobacter sp.]|nr:MAG: hypothetical protein COA44_11080 [Arcobacter sp.]